MIEKINLRGISRTPSDRMLEDGGCAESLNVQVVGNELEPMISPENVSASVGLPTEYRWIYIHKTPSYTNYIGWRNLYGKKRLYVRLGASTSAIPTQIQGAEFDVDDEIKSIISRGSILIVASARITAYIEFKNGVYTYLGPTIPEIAIDFRMRDIVAPIAQEYLFKSGSGIKKYYSNIDSSPEGIYTLSASKWNQFLNKNLFEGEEVEVSSNVSNFTYELWESLNTRFNQPYRERGYYSTPVFMRYAIRLYDGTYIHQSVPVLLVPVGSESYLIRAISEITQEFVSEVSTSYETKIKVSNPFIYKVDAKILNVPESKWESMIESVDIFVSTDVNPVGKDSKIISINVDSVVNPDTPTLKKVKRTATFGFDAHDRTFEDELLSKSVFYKVKSIPFSRLAAESANPFEIEPVAQDDLVVKPTLEDDYLSHDIEIPVRQYSYNGRTLLAGYTQRLYTGHPIPQSVSPLAGVGYSYKIKYYIQDDNGSANTVIGKNNQGVTTFVSPYTIDGNQVVPHGFMMYPNPRCFKAIVEWSESGHGTVLKEIAFKPHPFLNAAYAYWGLDQSIRAIPNVSDKPWTDDEDNDIVHDNMLIMSEATNPFVFPAGNRLTFNGTLVGLAATTTALTPGLLTAASLYIFSTDGIWAVALDNEGKFGAPDSLSRDVAIADTICAMDQGVVFVTEAGVMMMHGAQIQDISNWMHGEHYVVNLEVSEILRNAGYGEYLKPLTAADPFMKFMRKARGLWDYSRKRIIFFSEGVEYQYVYEVRSDSWHKMSLLQNSNFVGTIETYPDNYVLMGDTTNSFILSVTEYADEDFTTLSNVFLRVLGDNPADYEVGEYVEWYDWLEHLHYETVNYGSVRAEGTIYGLTEAQADALQLQIWATEQDIWFRIGQNTECKNMTLYNFSVPLDVTSEEITKAFVITRPIDMEIPDVRKTISSIRIRGNFDPARVRYLLLGSHNGRDFAILNSLRGVSWEWYRIIVVSELHPTERISWIDVEYEPRYTKKLR